jgi:uncharacterized protein YcbK (DUF882 family)
MNNDKHSSRVTRRVFLLLAAHFSAGAILTNAIPAFATTRSSNHLSFYHTHTGETLKINLKAKNRLTMRNVCRFLRDFRTGEVHTIDPQLLVILSKIQKLSGSKGTFEVISGYRSAATNRMLATRYSGVAKRSLHMAGRAIDIRLTDLASCDLHDIACSLKEGGVGYYPESDFVHIDTGRVRYWQLPA